ncbi:MAG: hypothetical protein AAB425_14170, partial [Bdellovibrionota bacterium]
MKILSASLVRLMPLIWIFLTFFPGFGLVDAADIKAVKPNPSPSPPVINTEEVVVVKRMPNPAAPILEIRPEDCRIIGTGSKALVEVVGKLHPNALIGKLATCLWDRRKLQPHRVTGE